MDEVVKEFNERLVEEINRITKYVKKTVLVKSVRGNRKSGMGQKKLSKAALGRSDTIYAWTSPRKYKPNLEDLIQLDAWLANNTDTRFNFNKVIYNDEHPDTQLIKRLSEETGVNLTNY